MQHAHQSLFLVKYWLASKFTPEREPCVRGPKVRRQVPRVVKLWLDALTIRDWGFRIV